MPVLNVPMALMVKGKVKSNKTSNLIKEEWYKVQQYLHRREPFTDEEKEKLFEVKIVVNS